MRERRSRACSASLLFVGYLWLIGRTKDIHRVFEYHGAEHKTIAAFEHGDDLEPDHVDRYPKEHVRCGTNFLIIVMVITIFVFTLFGTPGFCWRIGSRDHRDPGDRRRSRTRRCGSGRGSRLPRHAQRSWPPGIWLQKITTQQPDGDQIEVAIASFDEVLRREAEAAGAAG